MISRGIGSRNFCPFFYLLRPWVVFDSTSIDTTNFYPLCWVRLFKKKENTNRSKKTSQTLLPFFLPHQFLFHKLSQSPPSFLISRNWSCVPAACCSPVVKINRLSGHSQWQLVVGRERSPQVFLEVQEELCIDKIILIEYCGIQRSLRRRPLS